MPTGNIKHANVRSLDIATNLLTNSISFYIRFFKKGVSFFTTNFNLDNKKFHAGASAPFSLYTMRPKIPSMEGIPTAPRKNVDVWAARYHSER